jgi:copper(I)-binding protein
MTIQTNKASTTFFQKGRKLITISISVLLTCVLFAANANMAYSSNTTSKNKANIVQISEPWARATFALAKTGAAYFSISNNGKKAIVLTSVSVSSSIAMMSELHHTSMEDGMMRMQELEDGIKVNAGEEVELSPGGMHVMLMGLAGPLNKGESIDIELHFDDGTSLIQVFPILDKRN